MFPVTRHDFPVNDGGMFYVMVKDLQANHYTFPKYTTYNFSQIPYTYPPLPFYLAAGLEDLGGINLFTILRFLPGIFSILMIPAFYGLSREALGSNFQALHATLAFAIVPPAYEWLIMGGGLTRAPASLFSLLALTQALWALKTRQRKPLALTIVFVALSGYCHLEILWITLIFIAIAAWFTARDRWGLFCLAAIGFGASLLMSPYLILVLRYHGMQPFVSALQAGEFNWANSFGKVLLSSLTEEFLFTPILVFAILAFGLTLQKRDYLLPAWALATVIFDPRSIERSIIIPLCLLAGIAIDEIILPGLANLSRPGSASSVTQAADSDEIRYRGTLFPNLISAILVVYMLARTAIIGNLYLLGSTSTLDILQDNDQVAMQWVAENTATESAFIVLTPFSIWESNERAEWFPVLAQRRSITTVQGTEWLPANRFNEQQRIYQEVLSCAVEEIACLNQVSQHDGIQFTHVYLSGSLIDRETGAPLPLPIEAGLRSSPEYELIYEQDDVLIFARVLQ
ncbi:MAG: hypothetical protein JXA78_05520 [Anaerolineales bacterium]|nr:hypothetical protein [Anaerolineales bacterium]